MLRRMLMGCDWWSSVAGFFRIYSWIFTVLLWRVRKRRECLTSCLSTLGIISVSKVLVLIFKSYNRLPSLYLTLIDRLLLIAIFTWWLYSRCEKPLTPLNGQRLKILVQVLIWLEALTGVTISVTDASFDDGKPSGSEFNKNAIFAVDGGSEFTSFLFPEASSIVFSVWEHTGDLLDIWLSIRSDFQSYKLSNTEHVRCERKRMLFRREDERSPLSSWSYSCV